MSTDGEYGPDDYYEYDPGAVIGPRSVDRSVDSTGPADDDEYFGYVPTANKSSVAQESTTHDDLEDMLGDDDDDDIDDDGRGISHGEEEDDDDDENVMGGGPTLKQMADRACKKIDIGAAVLPGPLFTADVEDYDGSEELRDAVRSMPETHYARILRREFNAIVIEHHLKWSPLLSIDLHPPGTKTPGAIPMNTNNNNPIRKSSFISDEPDGILTTNPTTTATTTVLRTSTSLQRSSSMAGSGSEAPRLGRYDFYYADSIVDWAISKGINKIKGHVLVWHVTTPKLLEELEPEKVREELKRHIFTVIGHFRGRISTWDVVNEALAPDGSLAENIFLRKLGPSYIEDSFRWAHQADPDAILLYNDNKVEGFGSKKADGFYELLADLKAKQVPIHGCGLQAHWNAGGVGTNRPPTPRMIKQQIRRLGKLGLSVNISEMDVRVSKLNPPELRDVAQRQIYHDLIAAALSEPAVDGIWLWGFTDRHTWVSNFYYDDEPLIFDEYYQRKPAYYGLRDAIATLTPGHVIAAGYNTTTNDNNSVLDDTSIGQQQQEQNSSRGNTTLIKHKTVPLESDADDNGNNWGYAWMSPYEEVDLLDTSNPNNNDIVSGDARPDWEQQEQQQSPSDVIPSEVGKHTNHIPIVSQTSTGDENDPIILIGTEDDIIP